MYGRNPPFIQGIQKQNYYSMPTYLSCRSAKRFDNLKGHWAPREIFLRKIWLQFWKYKTQESNFTFSSLVKWERSQDPVTSIKGLPKTNRIVLGWEFDLRYWTAIGSILGKQVRQGKGSRCVHKVARKISILVAWIWLLPGVTNGKDSTSFLAKCERSRVPFTQIKWSP